MMWQPLTIGLAHLPRTFECLAADFEAGRVTCFEAAGGCAPPGAEMAVWGRKMVTLHCIASTTPRPVSPRHHLGMRRAWYLISHEHNIIFTTKDNGLVEPNAALNAEV